MTDRSQYETHHGWAINVKDREAYDPTLDPDNVLPDDRVSDIYYQHVGDFWEGDAQHLAHDHDFNHLYSEGRMGGWAVVEPQPSDDDWERGDASYNAFVARMEKLDRELHEAMDYHRDQFKAEVRKEVRLATAEPAEAAYWAARDVVTV